VDELKTEWRLIGIVPHIARGAGEYSYMQAVYEVIESGVKDGVPTTTRGIAKGTAIYPQELSPHESALFSIFAKTHYYMEQRCKKVDGDNPWKS